VRVHERLLLIPMLLVVSATAQAQTPVITPPHDGPVVVSSGEGLVRRAPDRAWVMASVEARARSPREAQKLNVDVMSAVLQKLKGLGLPAEAIQTRSYDMQPEYDYVNGKQLLRGYVARNTLEIRVDELPRVGEILDAAVASGATSVGNVRFDLKDRAAAEREALRLAVVDARRRADATADGAGMRVDRIVRIEEHRVGPIPPPRPMMAMRAEMGQVAAAEPPIEPGEVEIRATVTMTAAIR
jgi:uncharacterized protein YggE